MNAEKTIFLLVAIVTLSIVLWMAWKNKQKRFSVLFFLCLLCFMGFYLLNFGTLNQFNVEGLTAKAQFIRDTADDAGKLKDKIEQDAAQIKRTASEVSGIKRQLDAIVKAAAPRTITPEQEKAFLDAVKAAPKGAVRVIQGAGDGETAAYCTQVRFLLK